MSIVVPLTVRIKSATSDRHVTRELSDLSFEKGVPGGFKSCTLALARPIDVMHTDLVAGARVYVCDGRTAKVICEGELEDPGRSAGDNGQVWSLVVIGPSGHARNRETVSAYIDGDLDRWIRTDNVRPGATSSVGETGAGDDAITLQFPDGLHINSGDRVAVGYPLLREAGQWVGRVDYVRRAGQAGSFESELLVRIAGALSGAVVADTDSFTTTNATESSVFGTEWTVTPRDWPELRIIRSAAGVTIGNDNAWNAFVGVSVQAARYSKAGVLAITGYTTTYVTAAMVVADLLGRLLNAYDGANATIDASSYQIDQLVYAEPCTPADILDDLMLLEPTMFYEAGASNPANGLYSFNWRTWPTTVRYEASVADGFDAPQSQSDLYNRVTVRWTGPGGKPRVTVRTQTVTALDSHVPPIVREKSIDLGEGLGSSAAATQVGDGFLADHKYPSNRGTLSVSRPIRDNLTGQTVDPWEIEPGYLIRVRGVESYPDALNPSDRDGVTVFRVVEMSYSASDNTATLALDAPARSAARSLGVMQRRAEARR